jgi:hypothetical protein
MSTKPVLPTRLPPTPEQIKAWNEARVAFVSKWATIEAEGKLRFFFGVTDNSCKPRLDVAMNATETLAYIQAHMTHRLYDKWLGYERVGIEAPESPQETLQ